MEKIKFRVDNHTWFNNGILIIWSTITEELAQKVSKKMTFYSPYTRTFVNVDLCVDTTGNPIVFIRVNTGYGATFKQLSEISVRLYADLRDYLMTL